MAVIIGAGTTVAGFTGVVSASWDLNPSIQRLWQLGSWDPYDTIKQAQQNVNLTVYAGGGPHIIVHPPSSDCIDSTASFTCTIVPASCLTTVEGPSGTFFLTSYSYSKGDVRGYGQQTYAGTQWLEDAINGIEAPTYVLLGISEGQYTSGTDVLTPAQMGIVVSGDVDNIAEGYTGSVSAGFPGLGQATETTFDIYHQVGVPGAVGKLDGWTGNASTNVPHQPLWLPTP